MAVIVKAIVTMGNDKPVPGSLTPAIPDQQS